jgi:hypothetical protein
MQVTCPSIGGVLGKALADTCCISACNQCFTHVAVAGIVRGASQPNEREYPVTDTKRLEQRIAELERQVENLHEQLVDTTDRADAALMLVDLILAYNAKGITLTAQEIERVAPHIYDLKYNSSAGFITGIADGVEETLHAMDQIPDPQDKP